VPGRKLAPAATGQESSTELGIPAGLLVVVPVGSLAGEVGPAVAEGWRSTASEERRVGCRASLAGPSLRCGDLGGRSSVRREYINPEGSTALGVLWVADLTAAARVAGLIGPDVSLSGGEMGERKERCTP
jgi:hypothetical protein